MRKYKLKNLASLTLSLVYVGMASLGVCQEESTQMLSGNVSQTDWVGSKITVRVGSYVAGNVDEMTFYVPNDASITCGTEDMSLADIQVGDPVRIEYYRNSFSGFYVKRLQDSNTLNCHGL